MKLLFDQNISPKILKHLPPEIADCQQVRFVDLEDLICSNEKGLNKKYTEINEVLGTSSPALMAPLYKAFNEIRTARPWETGQN